MNQLPPDLRQHLQEICKSFKGISALWLIGSRANSRARADSDWDILAFADAETLTGLRDAPSLRRDDLDLLVVDMTDGQFWDPWSKKNGNLADWEWTVISETEAKYMGSKPPYPTTFVCARRLRFA